MSDFKKDGAKSRSFGETEAGFYGAFEDRFRGARKVIRTRLEAYLPFIVPLKRVSDDPEAVDLGCGRGEWLQFLRDQGFKAQGVDLDEGMLASCRKRGLKARKGDALEFLRDMPDDSQVIVSGFHLAEHLPFPQLQRLVREAHRVLKPGGLLILETPNPENLMVSTLSFYTDPTHLNPLPPDLLSFLTEYTGFKRNKIIRLQENERLRGASTVTLDEVLGGASPDYAVVAQNESDAGVLALFDEPFGKEYGLDASSLVERFDRTLKEESEALEGLAAAVDEERLAYSRLYAELEQMQPALKTALDEERLARARLTSEFEEMQSALKAALDEERFARTRLSSEIGNMQSALSNISARMDELYAASQQAEASLAAVYAPTSWRVTTPFRAVSDWTRWLLNGCWAWLTLKAGSRPRRVVGRLVQGFTRYVLVRPWLNRTAKRLIRLAPPVVETWIRSIAFGQVSRQPFPSSNSQSVSAATGLSARGKEIYAQLMLETSARKSR